MLRSISISADFNRHQFCIESPPICGVLLYYLCFFSQVADFGLAKISSDVNTHVSTRVMGTFG